MSQPPSNPFQHKEQPKTIGNIFTNASMNSNNIFTSKTTPNSNNPLPAQQRNVFAGPATNTNPPNQQNQTQNCGSSDTTVIKASEGQRNTASQFMNKYIGDTNSVKTEKKQPDSQVKAEGSKLAKKSGKSPDDAFISFGPNNPNFKSAQPQTNSQQAGGQHSANNKTSDGKVQTQQQQSFPVVDPNSNTLVQGNKPSSNAPQDKNTLSNGQQGQGQQVQQAQQGQAQGVVPSNQNSASNAQNKQNIFNQGHTNQANPTANNPANNTNIFNTQQQQQSQSHNSQSPQAGLNSIPSQDPHYVPLMKGEDYLAKQKILYSGSSQLTQQDYLEYLKESFDVSTLTVGAFLTSIKSSFTSTIAQLEHLWEQPECLLASFNQNRQIQDNMEDLVEDINLHPSCVINHLMKVERDQEQIERNLARMEEKVKGERQVHALSSEMHEMMDLEQCFMDYQLDSGHSQTTTELTQIYRNLTAAEHELSTLAPLIAQHCSTSPPR